MARTTDRERILNLLAEGEGLSNARIKTELGLGDDRYESVRLALVEEGLAEKYVCRGGGLRLTKRGEREISPEYEVASSVDKEAELYAPLVDALQRDNPQSIAFDTASLRKRGKWQNPDVTQIMVDVYPHLRRRRVVLTTFEVKQWGAWDVSAVFEASSHARFAHQGFVVLEWTDKSFSISDPRVTNIVRECQRFGIGMATLEPFYSQYRIHVHLEPESKRPDDTDVEEWLDYALSRRAEAFEHFNALMNQADRDTRRK